MAEFHDVLGNPTTLRAVGAQEADLARAASQDVCPGGNRQEASVEQIEDLYRSVC